MHSRRHLNQSSFFNSCLLFSGKTYFIQFVPGAHHLGRRAPRLVGRPRVARAEPHEEADHVEAAELGRMVQGGVKVTLVVGNGRVIYLRAPDSDSDSESLA